MSARLPLVMVGLVMGLLVMLSGCGGSSAPAPQSAAASTDAADPHAGWPKVIRVGLVPTEGGADTRKRFAPLRDHLQSRFETEVELVSASSYNGVITAMANDQLEFAWFGPKSYVEAAKRAGAEALLLERNKEGEEGYHSIFIVPADSPIQKIEDAKGLRFAFTDPNSTSGCLIPSTVLYQKLGMPPKSFFGEVSFSGSHGTSALQVASKELDIAATNDLDLEKMFYKGAVQRDQVRVIYTSDLIPGAPLACRGELPESLKKAFTEAVLELNDRPEVLEQFQNGGYVPITDEAYDIIRATQAFLEQQKQTAAGG